MAESCELVPVYKIERRAPSSPSMPWQDDDILSFASARLCEPIIILYKSPDLPFINPNTTPCSLHQRQPSAAYLLNKPPHNNCHLPCGKRGGREGGGDEKAEGRLRVHFAVVWVGWVWTRAREERRGHGRGGKTNLAYPSPGRLTIIFCTVLM